MHKKTTEMVAVSQLFRNFAPDNSIGNYVR